MKSVINMERTRWVQGPKTQYSGNGHLSGAQSRFEKLANYIAAVLVLGLIIRTIREALKSLSSGQYPEAETKPTHCIPKVTIAEKIQGTLGDSSPSVN